MCDVKVFTGVTEAQMNKIRCALRAQGLTVPFANVGEIRGKITAAYLYIPEDLELNVAVTKKPWYISCKRIENEIRKALDK
jgi:hypothetical protein